MQTPDLLALDFDGVICDGRQEYFQSGWRAYCELWQPANTEPPAGLVDRYCRLAAVIETDPDVPLLVQALMLEIPAAQILQDWDALVPQLLQQNNLTKSAIAAELSRVRDRWIAEDFEGWLALQPLYPGVAERLQELLASSIALVIVTNRIQRFALQLLQAAGMQFSAAQVFGKQDDRPKYQVLRELLSANAETLWFVEDHIRALHLVAQQPDLATVNLFLADWGFNTPKVRDSLRSQSRIRLLSFHQFMQEFDTWVE